MTQSTVEYRNLPGHPAYQIGDDGSVWIYQPRCRVNRERRGDWYRLVGAPGGPDSYLRVNLRINGRTATKTVSCLVLETFVGPRPTGMLACHFPDRNKANNALTNLRWDTRSANAMDRVAHGTSPRGEKGWNSKLTEADVRLILSRPRGSRGGHEDALRFNVSRSTIANIRRRKRTKWAWLETTIESP